jgi:hypothetical protein
MNPVPEIFPDLVEVFEVAGWWQDPATLQPKIVVRFFCNDRHTGKQVGQDAFIRIFDAMEFLMFSCCRQLRTAISIEPQEPTTKGDQERVSEVLRTRAAAETDEVLFREATQ